MKKIVLFELVFSAIISVTLILSFNISVLAQSSDSSYSCAKAQAEGVSINQPTVYENNIEKITGNAVSTNGALYKFWEYDASSKTWTIIRDYSSNNSVNWTPTHVGEYKIVMHVKDIKSTTANYDDYKYIVVNSLPVRAQAQTLTTNVSTIYSNDSVNIQGTAISKNGPLFRFWQYDSSTKQWTMLSDYSENNSIVWKPTHSGQYKIVMHVKDKKSTSDNCEDYKYIEVNSLPIQATAQSLVSDSASVYENDSVNIKGTATSKNGSLYQFWQYDDSTKQWSILSDYSENSSIVWKPTHSGEYKVVLHVKDKQSTTSSCDDYKAMAINVLQIKAKSLGIKTGATNVFQNEVAQITGSASSKNAVLYRFWEYDASAKTWTIIKDYSEDPNLNWTPTHTGNYSIVMHVKDKYSSTSNYDDYSSVAFKVYNSTSITDFNISSDKLIAGNKYTITANSISKNTVSYKFVVYNYQNSQSTVLKDYSSVNTVDWVPASSGSYKVTVYLRDEKTSAEYSQFIDNLDVRSGQLAYKVIVLDAGHGGYLNGGYDSGACAEGIYESKLNSLLVGYIGSELKTLGATVIYTNNSIDMNYSSTAQNLQDRDDVANNINADLFLSIHHDSSTSSSATGVSAHYSSYRPAVDNSDTYVSNDITYDSTPCKQATDSYKLASYLVQQLATMGFVNHGVSDHNLYVTEHSTVPAVLLECGFMSNHDELVKISNDANNQLMADKIVKAILNYFNN